MPVGYMKVLPNLIFQGKAEEQVGCITRVRYVKGYKIVSKKFHQLIGHGLYKT
jgi:hypothetical protein